MKLYLTLEDGRSKLEKICLIDEHTYNDRDRNGKIIEEMYDTLKAIENDLEEEDIILEARRLTVHND